MKVVAGSGLWNPAAAAWMAPLKGATSPLVPEAIRAGEPTDVRGGIGDADPAVFNVLFRGDEPMLDLGNATDAAAVEQTSKRVFQAVRQAEVLRTGTTGDYAQVLELARLQPGGAADPMILRPGTATSFTRTYKSSLDLEGLVFADTEADVQIVYLGRYQPYAVRVPRCVESGCTAWPGAAAPLVAFFHGGSGSHINQEEAHGDELTGPLAELRGAITASPFGRGRRSPWWRGPGELDVLEVIRAVKDAYPVDHDRVVALGASLGGYATFRFAGLYPGLFTATVAHCPSLYENSASTRTSGVELPQTQPFTIDPHVPSLVNLSLVQVSGTVDPLVRIASGHRVRDRRSRRDLTFATPSTPTGITPRSCRW